MANISPIKLVLPLFGKRTMPICATSYQYISTGMIPRTWYFSLRESTDAYWHALNARMSIYARNIDAISTKSLRERSQCIAIRKPKHRVPMAATIITSIFFGHMRITGRSSVVCSWSSIVVPPLLCAFAEFSGLSDLRLPNTGLYVNIFRHSARRNPAGSLLRDRNN